MTGTRLADVASLTHGMQSCLMCSQCFLAVMVHGEHALNPVIQLSACPRTSSEIIVLCAQGVMQEAKLVPHRSGGGPSCDISSFSQLATSEPPSSLAMDSPAASRQSSLTGSKPQPGRPFSHHRGVGVCASETISRASSDGSPLGLSSQADVGANDCRLPPPSGMMSGGVTQPALDKPGSAKPVYRSRLNRLRVVVKVRGQLQSQPYVGCSYQKLMNVILIP